jgi:hypothetical protein
MFASKKVIYFRLSIYYNVDNNSLRYQNTCIFNGISFTKALKEYVVVKCDIKTK